MAKNGMKVMNSDMHIIEPSDLWEHYIDPKFCDRAPKRSAGHENPSVLEIEDPGLSEIGERVFHAAMLALCRMRPGTRAAHG